MSVKRKVTVPVGSRGIKASAMVARKFDAIPRRFLRLQIFVGKDQSAVLCGESATSLLPPRHGTGRHRTVQGDKAQVETAQDGTPQHKTARGDKR